jgi:diguanylate cyclase
MNLVGTNSELGVSGADILTQLEAHRLPATPLAYEVWFAHLSGKDVALSRAITDRIAAHEPLTPEFLGELHGIHLSDLETQRMAEKSSRAVMVEINGIVELLKAGLGAHSSYVQTLAGVMANLATTNDPDTLAKVVEALVGATGEVQSANLGLQERLQASRSEVEQLRDMLEATRLETLQDALTGIANRKAFEQALQKAMSAFTIDRRPFCLLLLDIDFFKHFNDKHGHLLGDKVLKVVAQALRDKFPKNCTVARYGGEEFAVIIDGADLMAGWIGAEAARQTILSRELVKRTTGEKLGRITVSIGVASWSRNDTRQSFVGRADAALLRAKANGRNRTVTEDQLAESAVA